MRTNRLSTFSGKRYITDDELSRVALTGSYSDLSNLPTSFVPPTKTIELTSEDTTDVTWSANGSVATITHALNCYPIVQVYDDENEQVFPVVRILSGTSFELDFRSSQNPIGESTWICSIAYGGQYGNSGSPSDSGVAVIPLSNGSMTIPGTYRQEITVIPASSSEVELAEGTYQHIPSTATTYVLPDMQNDGVTHDIILTVDFSNVQTYAFEDESGNTIEPLPMVGTLTQGSVVRFWCSWEPMLGSWSVMPLQVGTRQNS